MTATDDLARAPAVISVVIPLFNEEGNVERIVDAIGGVFAESLPEDRLELILVDDGSSDGTLAAVRRLAELDGRVRVIALSRNFGHQAALTAGLERARGDAVITMDGDFQDPPGLIPALVAEWRTGSEIVYARRVRRHDTAFKRYSAGLYYRLMSHVSEVRLPRQVGDFRLVDRKVLNNLIRLGEHARYLRGMVAWLGFKHAFVDFDRPERTEGETGYPLARMVRLAMDGLLSSSFLPLRVGLYVGVASMLIAAVFLAYMAADQLFNPDPRAHYPLYKWLTVVLIGFVGAQFIFTWILGEYVGRIYNEVRGRPLYVVREEINFDAAPVDA